jgi:predicted DNA-binding protein (MmcQ/YjbR family)
MKDLAKQHGILAYSSNYTLYGDMSSRVVEVLRKFTPNLEVYSIDESFLQIEAVLKQYADPTSMGQIIKEKVRDTTGLPVCVGIGASKTLAKLANHLAKKHPQFIGVCDISSMPKEALYQWMAETAVGEVWGIGSKTAKKLKELGSPVDLATHFGFVRRWKLIAPFTNVERKGFDTVFPPEEKIDLAAAYPGKNGDVKWTDYTSTDEYGQIDFNKPYTLLKEVTGYAYTEFESGEEREAQIRLGCKNGWKVWLNGQLIFARDEYHRGAKLDQYKLPVKLQKGKNKILVKCCQNEQTESWTVEWQFQLRVCDATGTAIVAKN